MANSLSSVFAAFSCEEIQSWFIHVYTLQVSALRTCLCISHQQTGPGIGCSGKTGRARLWQENRLSRLQETLLATLRSGASHQGTDWVGIIPLLAQSFAVFKELESVRDISFHHSFLLFTDTAIRNKVVVSGNLFILSWSTVCVSRCISICKYVATYYTDATFYQSEYASDSRSRMFTKQIRQNIWITQKIQINCCPERTWN